MEIEVGDKVEYRSVGGLLETMRVDRIEYRNDGTTPFLVFGQGRDIFAKRITRVLETAS